MARPLSPASFWGRRMFVYLRNEFPAEYLLALLLFFLAAYSYGQFLSAPELPVLFGPRSLLATVAVFSFFFRLLVLREHKPMPRRLPTPPWILQTKILHLWDLRAATVIGGLLELGVSYLFGWRPVCLWLAAMMYVWLIRNDFFVGEWLRPLVMRYDLLRLLLLPLATMWVLAMGYPLGDWPWAAVGQLAGTAYLLGWTYEIARDLHAPQTEPHRYVSYTRLLTPRWAPILWLGTLLAGASLGIFVLESVAAPLWMMGIILVGFGLASWWGLLFAMSPEPARAYRLQPLSGGFAIAVFLLLVIAIALRMDGWHWAAGY